ncbi:hypothetical protein MLD38_038499 [Melastoma candidum]|uniref:Uncharacterized protein n=1 Tax=Melastoma candidum TaxID=119954 RepID=A0ACB9KZ33_9MYRT|nr:hypothetical protein MLD38_038499 [Melastoma candidum]
MPSMRGFSLRKHIFRLVKSKPFRTGNRFGGFGCVKRKLLNLLKVDHKLTSAGAKSGYTPLTGDEVLHGLVPKNHMAVYVGREDGELSRVLVPVVYFNHPLFRELLREAEEEYGFCQEGGITIPCGVSEFESVKTRVAEVSRGGSGPRWRKAPAPASCLYLNLVKIGGLR